MQRNSLRTFGMSMTLFLATLVLPAVAGAQSSQVQGLIIGRSGETMTVKSQQDSEPIVVLVTSGTYVEESEGLFKLKKQSGLTALIPGLRVQVKGSRNEQHQLVAETVTFKSSDLKTAQDIQAGLNPTQQQVAANQTAIQSSEQQIEASQRRIATDQQEIAANQQETAANKTAIVATDKRLGELGEYNILGQVIVYFADGKAALDPKYKSDLLALAQKAQTINGSIIQVQGYASAVGPAAFNQKLSMERADNVLAYLEQDCKIPLTNVLAPGAMGTSDQVASNQTKEGQAQNRRVVVRILQNKGIAGS